MTLKAQVSNIVSRIEQRTEGLPERVTEARRTLKEWGTEITRVTQKKPASVLVGAFVVGFLLAKVARHA